MDELRTALELATEDELQQIIDILFCRRFNPLDYFGTPEPAEILSKEHAACLDAIEHRFRFLAADGFTVLRQRSQELSYRQILVRVCSYLKLSFSRDLSTTDLEAEIFLNLMTRAWQELPDPEKASITAKVQDSLAQSKAPAPLPPQIQNNPMSFLLKGGSVVAVSSILRPWLLQQIARQFAFHFARYQVAKNAVIRGGTAAAAQLQGQIALKSAQHGMALSAARYGAVRTVFSFLGPILWGCLAADLGWKTIATNYGRIIPTVFALAQIRLLREDDANWQLV
ncbi:MAG: hypothetical protein GVY04_17920 [Cyanobacteria bacterium]|nr:hypothetical protein [Cyanobacteria bacterium GSL.Bin1]